MKEKTHDKIFQLISESNGITAKALSDKLKLNASGLFRHLKKLQAQKKIYKIGKSPKVRYYAYMSIQKKSKIAETALNWALSGALDSNSEVFLIKTRDVLQVRVDHLIPDLKRIIKDANLVYLIDAAVGEIGNNSFDHNLGNWIDTPGIYFQADLANREIVLADRGQGVYQTIKGVRPGVKDDLEAVRVAFTESISGRAPEQRGNGLKFVRKTIQENRLSLEFYSGHALCRINANGIEISRSEISVPGTLAIINF